MADQPTPNLTINWSYVKSIRAVLLQVALVLSLVALILTNSTSWCIKNYTCQISGYTATYYFYSFITFIAFITSIFNLGFYAISLDKLISDKLIPAIGPTQWLFMDTVHCCILCIVLLMANILMSTRIGSRAVFQAAIVSGVLALVVYTARLYLMTKQIKNQSQAETETEDGFKQDEPTQPRLEFIAQYDSANRNSSSSSGSDNDGENGICPGAWKPLEDNQSTQNFTVEVLPSATPTS